MFLVHFEITDTFSIYDPTSTITVADSTLTKAITDAVISDYSLVYDSVENIAFTETTTPKMRIFVNFCKLDGCNSCSLQPACIATGTCVVDQHIILNACEFMCEQYFYYDVATTQCKSYTTES
jgi:hypothetical protein